jgi:hypothetical protein
MEQMMKASENRKASRPRGESCTELTWFAGTKATLIGRELMMIVLSQDKVELSQPNQPFCTIVCQVLTQTH